VSASPSGDYAEVHGSPGARVRFLGYSTIYWPFLLALFLGGWFLQAALPAPVPRTAAGVALGLLVLAAWAASGPCARRFDRILKGARGEEEAARQLALLPAGWTVLHGVPRGGFDAMAGGGDFDHVAVGPRAVFVVETKNWRGPVRVERGAVTVAGLSIARSPVAQARREARDLARLLRGVLPDGTAVRGVVCFAGDSLEGGRADVDGTPLCNLSELRALLRSLDDAAPAALPADVRARAVAALLARLADA
jgi:hypothetical protein